MNACDHGSGWPASLACARYSAIASSIASALLAIAAHGADFIPQDQPIADGGPAPRPTWTAAVDAMMLWQANAQSVPLFLDSNGATAFDAQDLGTQMGAGARGVLQRSFGACHAIEGVYFQARPFNAESDLSPFGGPYELTNTGDLVFNDIEAARITSSGWIQSAECNWRARRPDSPLVWIAGFRWVELNSNILVDYSFANPDPYGSGSILSSCGNNLYGGQLGGDLLLWNNGGPIRVNCIGKAGLFYNSMAFQRSSAGFVVTDTGENFPLGTVSATADQTSFFGEIGLNAEYRLTSWLSWRVGYSFFWAAGVAVAARQLPLNNFGDLTASIDTGSNLFLHGVTTGIEARW